MTFHNVIIPIKWIVNENENKYFYNIFLEKGLYKDKLIFAYYKCYIIIELTFLEGFLFIKQAHQKRVMFVTIGISSITVVSFKQMSAIGVMIY